VRSPALVCVRAHDAHGCTAVMQLLEIIDDAQSFDSKVSTSCFSCVAAMRCRTYALTDAHSAFSHPYLRRDFPEMAKARCPRPLMQCTLSIPSAAHPTQELTLGVESQGLGFGRQRQKGKGRPHCGHSPVRPPPGRSVATDVTRRGRRPGLHRLTPPLSLSRCAVSRFDGVCCPFPLPCRSCNPSVSVSVSVGSVCHLLYSRAAM
jgi:hypothetical protein